MISSHDHFNRPGGDSLPIQRKGTGNGLPDVRIMGTPGATLPFGTVVMAGRDESFDQFDAGAIAGPFSSMQNAELPAAAALYALTGLFGVVTEEDGILVGERGRVETGRSTLQVRVLIPASGGLAVGQALMPDFAGTPGRLIAYDGEPGGTELPSAKPVALVAQKIAADAAINGTEQLIYVRFDGTNGWA